MSETMQSAIDRLLEFVRDQPCDCNDEYGKPKSRWCRRCELLDDSEIQNLRCRSIDMLRGFDAEAYDQKCCELAEAKVEIKRLQAAINSIRTTYVRTVRTHIAEGPYPVAGFEQVLVGDWELIESLQTVTGEE